jgi:hypothetical protein
MDRPACGWETVLLDCCEVGVEVPGVSTAEELLVDEMEEVRPTLEAESP